MKQNKIFAFLGQTLMNLEGVDELFEKHYSDQSDENDVNLVDDFVENKEKDVTKEA